MNLDEPELVPIAGRRLRVVVGVDGSRDSIAALRAGAWAAAARGATLVAVTAWTVPLIAPHAPSVLSDLRTAAVGMLRAALEDAFHGSAVVPIDAVVRSGSPASVLVEEAADALLLVVGTRGHGGFVGLLVGSVSSACAVHAPCPVLVMHHGDPLPRASGSPAGRVVVGVGSGEGATSVLRVAAAAAAEMDADLLAVTAWDDVVVDGGTFIDIRADVRDAARARLDERIAEAFPLDRPARLRTELREGFAAAILIEESRTADLVVVGRRGSSTFASVLLGSVCLPVAERAAAAVLVVPAAELDEDGVRSPARTLMTAS
jgi:nucleotide-binding universal stress UspA family protein